MEGMRRKQKPVELQILDSSPTVVANKIYSHAINLAHLQCNNLKRFSLFFGGVLLTIFCLCFTSAVSYYTGDEP